MPVKEAVYGPPVGGIIDGLGVGAGAGAGGATGGVTGGTTGGARLVTQLVPLQAVPSIQEAVTVLVARVVEPWERVKVAEP